MENEQDYIVDYGLMSESIRGTLKGAMKQADKGITYTQMDVSIKDAGGYEVAIRHWWGCTDGIEECTNPISYGNYGYYDDWYANEK